MMSISIKNDISIGIAASDDAGLDVPVIIDGAFAVKFLAMLKKTWQQ